MQVFEEVCRIQGETNLQIHQLKIGNDKDKWLQIGFRTVFSDRIRNRLINIYSNLATDVAMHASLGKPTYEVPSFDPQNILIKNRGEISSLCRIVSDLAEGIMDKAPTMTAISTSLQQPVINIADEASTPTKYRDSYSLCSQESCISRMSHKTSPTVLYNSPLQVPQN